MSPRVRRAAAVVVGMLAWLPTGGAAATPSAHASPAAEGVTIRLRSQTPWAGPDDTVVVRLAVGHAPEGSHVAALLHGSVGTRSSFAAAVDGTIGTGVIRSLPDTPVPAGDTADVRLTLPLDDGTHARPGEIVLTGEGVYPLELRVVGSDGTTGASITTFVVRLPARPAQGQPSSQPLRVATVLPIAAPPSHQPDGSIAVGSDTRAAVVAWLGAVRSTSKRPAPVDLIITPELLDALANGTSRDRGLLESLATGLAGTRVQAAPWVDVDLPGWLAQPTLAARLPDLLTRGTVTLTDRLHAPVDDSWVLGLDNATPATVATPSTLTWLRKRGVRQVLIPDGSLAPIDQKLTGTQPFELSAEPSHSVRALQIDRGIQQHFAAADPVLGANQLVADLAVLALDLPGEVRGAVVAPPARWAPDAAFLAALRSALDKATPAAGAGALPLIRPVTLDTLFAEVPTAAADGSDAGAGGHLVRDLRSETPNDLSSLAGPLADTTQRLEAWAQMVATTRRSRLTAELKGLRTTLAVAGSRDLGPVARRRYLDAIDGHVLAAGAAITLPREQTVTLTARTASIPFTIRSELRGPVTVELHLESSGRLHFPDGSTKVVAITGDVAHVQLRVRVATPGDATLRVRVTSPGGQLPLGETRLTVRSTAMSGVGLAITMGALAFLFVWWARHGWKARRKRLANRIRPADLITIDEPLAVDPDPSHAP